MSEVKEEFPIGKIEYNRYKKSHSDKIVYRNGGFRVERTTRIKGYDVLMRKWDIVKETKELLALSALKNAPSKSVEASIIVFRSATDIENSDSLL